MKVVQQMLSMVIFRPLSSNDLRIGQSEMRPTAWTVTSIHRRYARMSRYIVGNRVMKRVLVDSMSNGKNREDHDRWRDRRRDSRAGVMMWCILFNKNIYTYSYQ
jgi:hypothetical protein